MNCPTCGPIDSPVTELDEGLRMVLKCPKCNTALGIAQNQSVAAPVQIPGTTGPVSTARGKSEKLGYRHPNEPLDVLKAAKVRLAYLEREIKQLRKLETERDSLKRLLHAAQTPALKNVSRLRTAGD